MRNGDETEEWNEKQNHRGNAEHFQSTFSRSGMKQCLEFALAKLRGTLQIFG